MQQHSAAALAPRTGAERAAQATSGLVVESITKTFGSTTALDDVTTRFSRGTVHGLIGENGSGKSTLVKIIAGIHHADTGQVSLDGDLIAAPGGGGNRSRVACVYQDGSLIEELTVGQNIDLMIEPEHREALGPSATWSRNLLDDIGLTTVSLDSLVQTVPANEQRLIEIGCVLAKKPDVILFDESTSTLDQHGVDRVLQSMRDGAAAGACVLFVTHRLREMLAVAEDITVLRDGAMVAEFDAASATEEKLVQEMAGREVAGFSRRLTASTDTLIALTAADLTAPHCGPVDLKVTRGEIIGIGGASGNGQAELIRALAGEGIHGGTVHIGDKQLRRPEDGPDTGVVFVSSDRRFESLFSLLSIRENYTLALDATSGRWWSWLSRRREVEAARTLADKFGLVRRSLEQPVSSLSGGNQQKVAIGRAIAGAPSVLLIEEPTEGVDVRSRYDIYRSIIEVAETGTAVVFTSSDAGELRTLADRVIVMARGREVAELRGEEVTEEAIVHAFSTATAGHEQSSESTDAPASGYRAERVPRSNGRAWNPSTFVLLALIIVGLGAYATTRDVRFASIDNIGGILLLSLPLILVAIAQLPVMMVGEIDASLGSMMGLIVVGLSFAPDLPVPLLIGGAIVGGAILGAFNALLVVVWKVPAVIATIATLGIFIGVARILRPTPGGLISFDLSAATSTMLGSIPLFFVVAVVFAITVDYYIGRTRRGLRTRAVGYSTPRALQLGVKNTAYKAAMYVTAGATAGLAGITLAGQTGVGDAGVGAGYTLLSLAVPVIGGAALAGGRGTAIGCVLAALFIAQVQTFIPFIDLPSGGYLITVGVLTVMALIVASGSTSPLRALFTRPSRKEVKP
ncbi:ATP-binding cassette domain-containing protein [Rhodococcus sp. AD45]|uniref:ATP-binding cassette domain-containing protein n=1 Tax=Rhodococcus sp. (strain AD45) TaxID=103808 RepID=UPI0005D313C4|nr:ATP-binding cassette domain-containing protein [Rhodococcus sp. AD45]KJF19280.1 Ribose import ATP-binding protein RbsA [Rhodococcus sp. AD45]